MGDTFDDIEDLLIPHETLKYAGKTFKLQGLGLPEIAHVLRMHYEAISPIYDLAAAGQLPADAASIAIRMAEDFTPVASAIIACGMRKPAAIDKVAQLPFALQVEALDKIIRLTLDVEGGLGKVVEIVTQALVGVESLQNLQSPPSR